MSGSNSAIVGSRCFKLPSCCLIRLFLTGILHACLCCQCLADIPPNNWNKIEAQIPSIGKPVFTLDNQWVIKSVDSVYYLSLDGSVEQQPLEPYEPDSIAYRFYNRQWLGVNEDRVYSSENGLDWTPLMTISNLVQENSTVKIHSSIEGWLIKVVPEIESDPIALRRPYYLTSFRTQDSNSAGSAWDLEQSDGLIVPDAMQYGKLLGWLGIVRESNSYQNAGIYHSTDGLHWLKVSLIIIPCPFWVGGVLTRCFGRGMFHLIESSVQTVSHRSWACRLLQGRTCLSNFL